MEHPPFALPPSVKLGKGPGGLERFEIRTPLAEAHVYLHGAHVEHFQAAGQAPLLFASSRSYHEEGRPIRGGVPIIFPWFSGSGPRPDAPSHGLVRTRPWKVHSVEEQGDGSVELVFTFEPDQALAQEWGGGWALEYRVHISGKLQLSLTIRNTGGRPLECDDALHTYFAISDIRHVELLGLEGKEYLTIIEDLPRKREGNAPIRFTGETDRIYLDTPGPYRIVDKDRVIHIAKEGSRSAIVWNPWVAKSKTLVDFDPDEWPRLLCVETGNVAENRLHIAPGSTHTSVTTLWAESL